MSLVLTDMQKVQLSIQPVDGAGNPAPVDGPPIWESSDPGVLTLEASTDGMSAIASAVGPLGAAQVKVSADADLGEGVETITGILDVQIVADKAVSLAVQAGVPEPK